jgi:uncharacterized protein YdeI (YjbR/CyaY-like superfamily)
MKPLVKKKFLMEKYPGKGGWTFVRIPKLPKSTKKNFGYVKVKGTIDGFRISKYNIMPMKDGNFFLPIRTEIRKKIGKEAGAMVEVILYPDNEPLKAPKELLECLADEPAALKFFKTLTDSNKKYYIEWIYSAKKEETKVERMARSIDRLAKGLKMYDMEA